MVDIADNNIIHKKPFYLLDENHEITYDFTHDPRIFNMATDSSFNELRSISEVNGNIFSVIKNNDETNDQTSDEKVEWTNNLIEIHMSLINI